MIRRFVLTFVLLCLPSVCNAQAFNNVVDSGQYPQRPHGAIIPINENQAILAIRYEPRNGSVVDVSIIPSISYNSGGDTPIAENLYGWTYYYGESQAAGSYRIDYCVISPEYLYCRTSLYSSAIIRTIQQFLTAKNLGTVQQRAAYIAGFKVKNVNIIDTSSILTSFKDLLGPWANIAVGLMIALFALEFGTRNTKQLAGQAAKEARAADRRVQRREIRDDPIAGQFRAHMDNLASVFRDTYGYYDSSTRAEAKELFDQAALDYAKYKKSRGWAL